MNTERIAQGVWVLIFGLFACVHMAEAQPASQIALLRKGAIPSDVLTNLGEPNERIERETKRETVWIYPAYALTFHEGQLSAWSLLGSSANLAEVNVEKESAVKAPNEVHESDSHVDDIISEILREVPADSSGPSPGAGVPAAIPLEPRPPGS